MKWFVFLVFLLCACGTERDNELTGYITVAAGILNADVSKLSWYFDDDNAAVAKCVGKKSIVFTRKYFEAQTEQQRVVTAMHEIGHCSLNLAHEPALKDGCPVSFMHPSISSHKNCLDAFYLP